MLDQSRGVYIVAQTPFDDEGGLDLDSIDSLADFYCRHGANGLTVLGVAGEAPKLTLAESRVAEACDLFDCYLPLLTYENQAQWGVAVRKEILKRRGAIRSAVMRAPGPVLTDADRRDIDLLVERVARAIERLRS